MLENRSVHKIVYANPTQHKLEISHTSDSILRLTPTPVSSFEFRFLVFLVPRQPRIFAVNVSFTILNMLSINSLDAAIVNC